MIISASYKTDIPAFYGEWFLNRLNAGYCKTVNPYRHQISKVSLKPEDVSAFVFWTKNLGRFISILKTVHERSYPFVIQYTINAYPRVLEVSVIDAARSIEHMRFLAGTYGPRVAVWRYDTIIFTSETPVDFHKRNFERLACALEGTTDEVVISFAHFYRKTRHNLKLAAEDAGFTWDTPADEIKRNLATELAQIAHAHGMQLSMCSQRQYLAPGVEDARCVDVRRLSDMAGHPILAKAKGNRPDCGCHASKDIGEYDTCPHGCVYCYAVQNRKLAQMRYSQHDPKGEFLFAPSRSEAEDNGAKPDLPNSGQLSLF